MLVPSILLNTYVAENGSCESSDDTAAQLDCESETRRVVDFRFGFFGYISKDDLVAEFIYSKLTNCVRYLSVQRRSRLSRELRGLGRELRRTCIEWGGNRHIAREPHLLLLSARILKRGPLHIHVGKRVECEWPLEVSVRCQQRTYVSFNV